MPKFGYVRCRVSLGFFENEFYVVVNDSAAFVGRENVRIEYPPAKDKDVEGFVLAYIIDEQSDRTLVELPGQPAMGGLRTWVPNEGLAAA
jgi:hypothetical protein